jgi:hypothetical protein
VDSLIEIFEEECIDGEDAKGGEGIANEGLGFDMLAFVDVLAGCFGESEDAEEEDSQVEAAERDTYHGEPDEGLEGLEEVVFVEVTIVDEVGLNFLHRILNNNLLLIRNLSSSDFTRQRC